MTRNEGEALLARHDISWPQSAPDLDAPFVELVDFRSAFRERQTIHCLPPWPPEREVATEWDEDGWPVATRTLTDEEFAAAQAAYERATAEWHATGGKRFVQGPEIPARATFRTSKGGVATGDFVPGQGWRWTAMTW